MNELKIRLNELQKLAQLNDYKNASNFAMALSRHFTVRVVHQDGSPYVTFSNGHTVSNTKE